MKSKFAMIAISIVITLSSCQQEEIENPSSSEETTNQTFIPTTQGNYWVYEYYNIMPDEGESQHRTDSVYIENDTLINNSLYHHLKGTQYGNPYNLYFTDDNNTITKNSGTILFTTNNIGEIFSSDTLENYYTSTRSVNPIIQTVSVPAGEFEAYEVIRNFQILLSASPWAPSKEVNHYYVENVGLISEEAFYMSTQTSIQRKLLRYHIN